jgi:release factor glutamine methyltransferase
VLLRKTLTAAIDRLTAAQVPSPRLNAELLLMFTLNCDRAYFHAHPERPLTPQESQRYEEALARRASGIPAQYITGHQEFWGLDFLVSLAVLIPRPETEHVIETVLQIGQESQSTPAAERQKNAVHSASRGWNEADEALQERKKIIDVGTGSGCIAIALATELPAAEIHATDISKAALEIARTNAVRLGQSRIQFHESDLFPKLEPRNFETGSFDFVVSNPPYVGKSEEDQVQLDVRKHEPRIAVFAGPTGLEIIERLVPQARKALKPGGWLAMEISGTIVERVRSLLSGWSEVQIVNDLQGIPRVVVARAHSPAKT